MMNAQNLNYFIDVYLEKDLQKALSIIDDTLKNRNYLVDDSFSKTDEKLYISLMTNAEFLSLLTNKKLSANIMRYIEDLKTRNIVIKSKVANVKNDAKPREDKTIVKDKFEEGGKYVPLKDAKDGAVVVRFPPEASGYLHIGHAKAAFINYHYKNVYNGKLLLRFDDTNPDKDSGDFQSIILEDIKHLAIEYDSLSYTSDHFETMLGYCEKLLKEGKAYVDFTEPDLMKKQREQCEESVCRSHSIDENLRLWKEMKAGSEEGLKCAVRAKFDMSSNNGCMRDPTIYRCKTEPHVRTGDKYKVYPTYDFACPIVDSIESVTHSLRTSEYNDRNEQFFKFIEILNLRKPEISDYSRLNLQNTVLSKRKLTWIVNEGYVDGWDDPRMPTIRGILRHGLTMDALKQFIIAQGFGRSIATMSWDKIWAFNKKVIDPVVPRFTALKASDNDRVNVTIQGQNNTEEIQVPKHPKDASIGNKTIILTNKVTVEKEDAVLFELNTNVTFINWGNMLVKSIERNCNGEITNIICEKNIDDKNFKKTLKITWLPVISNESMTPIMALYYDNLINKSVLDKNDDFKDFIDKNSKHVHYMIGDSELSKMKKGEICQLQRKGYFICDREKIAENEPLVLINIPEGKDSETKSIDDTNKPQNKKQVKKDKSPDNQSSGDNSKKKAKDKKVEDSQKPNVKKEKKVKDNTNKVEPEASADNVMKKQTRLGMEAKKEIDLAMWYKQAITKSDMLSYYNVSGCYIIHPWGYFIWEEIVNYFNAKIRTIGVDNCVYPMFVTEECLKTEKDHISDFSPEVAWVTRSGDTEMESPIAIRPTSETVMYPTFAEKIQSHEDLPLRVNQWCNVVRWEFKQPTPFLRSREFQWQEGHTVHETTEAAQEEVYQILEFYAGIYEELLAIPVVRGKKTEKEKFAGADFTTTVEAYVSAAGRAIQGATSHHLGQNFSKMFNITFQTRQGTTEFGWQNSWGITTRTLGVLVMIHGDNKGLVLPPRVAKIQVVIVPVGIKAKTTEEERENLLSSCVSLQKHLTNKCEIRTHFDNRDRSPGWKFNHWELKGVPIRLELGPTELASSSVVLCYRYNGEKETVSMDDLDRVLKERMVEIHRNMYEKAKKELDDNRVVAYDMNALCEALEHKKLITAPFCGDKDCEGAIRKLSEKKATTAADSNVDAGCMAPSMGAKSLCCPFETPKGFELGKKCVNCDKAPKCFTMFGRSY